MGDWIKALTAFAICIALYSMFGGFQPFEWRSWLVLFGTAGAVSLFCVVWRLFDGPIRG
jgi:hypothetical protein